jgi:hypothetical protein
MVPELSYKELTLQNGGQAMIEWPRMISMPESEERQQLIVSLTEYCTLDTFSMVRIYQKVSEICL